MAEHDPVDKLELEVAIGASQERTRHEYGAALDRVKDDLRRDIKLYVGLGVAAGNALAAIIAAKLGPSEAASTAARAVRSILPL